MMCNNTIQAVWTPSGIVFATKLPNESMQQMSNRLNDTTPSFIYFIHDGKNTKIGKSNNPRKRLSTLQTGNSAKLELLGVISCDTQTKTFKLERTLHNSLNHYRLKGEWFDISRTEVEDILKKHN